MKYAWIDEQRNDYELDEICSVLEVSVSGYLSVALFGKLTAT